MAGYKDFSKSNNAIEAEENGLFPASIIAKKTKTTAKFITDNYPFEEWHHTSSHFNKTYYYNLEDIQKDLKKYPNKYKTWKQKFEKPNDNFIAKKVEWIDWGGTNKHPKPFLMSMENISVNFNGKSSYSWLNRNGTKITKREGTNGFKITK